MRQSRLVHLGLFMVSFAIDFFIQAIFNTTDLGPLTFVSQIHFLTLLLMTKEDDRFEITFKVILVCLVLDLMHLQTFPIFYVSYGIAAIIIRIWYRHIGETMVELSLLMALGLFVKEIVLYMMLIVTQSQSVPLNDFIIGRTIWVILGNLIFVPLAKWMYDYSSRIIGKITYR